MEFKKFNVRVRVHYSEVDRMSVVYHGNYFRYFETGRTELLRHIGFPYEQLEESGLFFVVVQAHAEYSGNAGYDKQLNINTWVDLINHASIRFQYEVASESAEKIIVSGYTTLACLGKNKHPTRLPATLLSALSGFYAQPI